MPHDSELAYFRSVIHDRHGAAIQAGEGLPEGTIRDLVEGGPFTSLDASAREELVRELEGAFVTRQRRGSMIVEKAQPWLTARRPDIDFFYWGRLRRYYLATGTLPAHVLARLDEDTNEVLDSCGDPRDPSSGPRRGMVMGHVQSGKTTNYSALICKAADAGYKVVILLAGITNSLRAQTQERLDQTFIGKKSLLGPVASEPMPIQNYASVRRIPSSGTTRDSDFVSGRDGFYFSLSGHAEPIIFVTKKNKGVLERLRDWLNEQHDVADFPLLLIDDEADNASINTAKDPRRTTAINRVIREILGRFPRSAYVGYTATPFANIFIDPDTPAEMETDDLFPRHFIKALDPPTNYVGSRRVFWEKGDLREQMVRTISDFRSILPLSHKSHELPASLPPSLRQAIRVFCLSRAIRVARGDGRKHCSMMINVSRFNAVQEVVHGLTYEYLTRIKEAVDVHSGLPPEQIDDPIMQELRATFAEEYDGCGTGFDDLLPLLPEAVGSIQTRTVNMRGGTLDYSQHREHGLHVIAVGGLALSRGLTLEDLTVSYILRNTAASDTLMQMARWFGYRKGFEDICRLYLPQISLDHYEEVDGATEELRLEIKRMETMRSTPADFGLKVRQSPLAMRVTAANKMRTATAVTIAQDYSARHVEGHALPNSNDSNVANTEAVTKLLTSLGEPHQREPGYLLWQNAEGAAILDLIRSFSFAAMHPDLGRIAENSLLYDYVADRVRSELAAWDVAIPQLQKGEEHQLAGLAIRPRSRAKGLVQNGTYRVNGQKNRVADKPDVAIGMRARPEGTERDVCAARERPLMLIHVFNPSLAVDGVSDELLDIRGPAVTLSFALPGSTKAAVSRIYQVNAIYRRQLELFGQEADDDADAINEDDHAG